MIRVVSQNHLAENVLPEYVMAKSSEAEAVRVEERLLICQGCRKRSDWLDALAHSNRSAASAAQKFGAERQD